MKRLATLTILAALAAPLAPAEAQTSSAPEIARTVAQRLLEANYHQARQAWARAIPLCESVVSDPAATLAEKRRAFDMLVDIPRRSKRNIAQALEAADRMTKALSADPQAVHDGYVLQADMHWEANQKPEAIAKLRKYVEANSAQTKLCSGVEMKLALWLLVGQNWKDAYAEAARSVEFDASDDKQVATALGCMGEAAWKSADLDKCVTAYRRMLEPRYAAARTPQEIIAGANRISDCMVKLKRTDELLAHYSAFAKQAPELAARQEYALRAANMLYGELNRPEDALAAYEQFFVDASGICDRWFEAQSRIVEILRKLDRPREALQAAKICLDACGDAGGVNQWTLAVMDLMRRIDNDVARANRFLEYQQLGPAGKDQTPGTADDLTNPLADVEYPAYESRQEAFAKARAAAGDSARASRLRAMTYIYTGKPAEALKHFADAFGRCTAGDMRLMSGELVTIGVRGVQGHAAGLDRYFQFIAFGPAGPDGKSGTSDDLSDVFAAMGVEAPALGTGGLADIPPDQLKGLKELVPLLEDASQHWRPQSEQKDAIAALSRAHVALCDWGARGQKEWYVRQMLLSDNAVQAALSDGALASAKAGQLHLGEARKFYAQLAEAAGAADVSLQPEAAKARDSFKAFLDTLEKPYPKNDLRPKAKPFPTAPPGKR